jgi:hypothetical protein
MDAGTYELEHLRCDQIKNSNIQASPGESSGLHVGGRVIGVEQHVATDVLPYCSEHRLVLSVTFGRDALRV